MRNIIFNLGCALVLAGTHLPTLAGSIVWTNEQVSGAINYAGRDHAVRYAPVATRLGGPPQRGAVVVAIQATRDFPSGAAVQTKLCWNGLERCIPIASGSLRSHELDGLDARGPFYLVHRVPGKGPLAQPLFIKGSVTVWYQ